MQLSIKERIIFPQLLPQQGNRLTMKALKTIEEKVDFSAEELEEYEIKPTESGNITYNDADKRFDIDLSQAELRIVKEHYLKLDSEENLNTHTYALGERILEEIKEEE